MNFLWLVAVVVIFFLCVWFVNWMFNEANAVKEAPQNPRTDKSLYPATHYEVRADGLYRNNERYWAKHYQRLDVEDRELERQRDLRRRQFEADIQAMNERMEREYQRAMRQHEDRAYERTQRQDRYRALARWEQTYRYVPPAPRQGTPRRQSQDTKSLVSNDFHIQKAD